MLLCDVYHHFEDPMAMMAEVRRVCKKPSETVPGGKVVLIDFYRDTVVHWSHPDAPEWILRHVRGGREEFCAEILSQGFRMIREAGDDLKELKENYVIEFEPLW